MRKNTKLLDIDLHLFDGAAGGGAAAPTGDGAAMQGNESALSKADIKRPGSSRRAKTGAFDNVIFGKQDEATSAAANGIGSDAGSTGQGKTAGVETTSNTLEAKRAAFKELIEGEYKDQYTEMFQSAFNRRFKDMKSMENSLSAQKPVIDMLMQRYNVTDGDMAKLQTALEQDDAYWEEAADKAGLTIQQYKSMQKLERENAELRQIQQRQASEQQAQQQMAQWASDEKAIKEIYPSFNLRNELGDKQFRDLLKAGIPMQRAYETIHMDEIMASTAKVAAQSAGQQMVAKLQNRAARPNENGTSSSSAVTIRSDVHSLSKAERAEAVRRAQRGDIIKF